MLQGKKTIETYLARVEAALGADPFQFVREGAGLTDEERKYLEFPCAPNLNQVYSIPGIVDRFIDNLRKRIPDELLIFDKAQSTYARVFSQFEAILKGAKRLDTKDLALARRSLADVMTRWDTVKQAYLTRNAGSRGKRSGDFTKWQEQADKAVDRYDAGCDTLAGHLVELLSMLPATDIRELVDVLRYSVAPLREAYDREIAGDEDERARSGLFASPKSLGVIRTAIVDYMRSLLLQLTTIQRRALLYKSPTIDPLRIVALYGNLLNVLPYFRDLESRVKPGNPIDGERRWSIAVFPTGRMTSPYTHEVTSRGKETRMVDGGYYNVTNVILLSGTADAMLSPGDVSETKRIFGEYVFDTLTLQKDYIRDPVGIGKARGAYYSVIKARLAPDRAELLKDTLDLRYHFSEDFVRFTDHLLEGGDPLPKELHDWFMGNLVNPDYYGGGLMDDGKKSGARGIFGNLFSRL